MSKVEEQVSRLAEPIAAEIGARIYDTEYKKEGADWFLRVFLYKESGITIDDCEYVSRKLDKALDENDLISNMYYLEVSSPGIERNLKYDWHFETAVGMAVEAKLYSAVNGRKKIDGMLEGFDEDKVTVKTDDGVIDIDREKISNIKLLYRSDLKNE